jgi:hypothetical protein
MVASGATGQGQNGNQLVFSNLSVNLKKVDGAGQSVDPILRSTKTNGSGEFAFPGLAPDTYAIEVKPSSFLIPGGGFVATTLSNADVVNNVVSPRGLRAEFIDFRFFLSSTPRQNVLFATGGTGSTPTWFAKGGGWQDVANVNVQYGPSGGAIQITASDAQGVDRVAQIPRSSPAVTEIGRQGDQYLIRLKGRSSDFAWKPAVSGGQVLGGEGEGTSASAVVAARSLPSPNAPSPSAIPLEAADIFSPRASESAVPTLLSSPDDSLGLPRIVLPGAAASTGGEGESSGSTDARTHDNGLRAELVGQIIEEMSDRYVSAAVVQAIASGDSTDWLSPVDAALAELFEDPFFS